MADPPPPPHVVLGATIDRNQRFVARQRGEILQLLQQETPEAAQEKAEFRRQLDIQYEVLNTELSTLETNLTDYEGKTAQNGDAAVTQNKQIWGDLCHDTLVTLTEARQRLRTLAPDVAPVVPNLPRNDGHQGNNPQQVPDPDLTANVNRLVDMMAQNGVPQAQNQNFSSRLPKLEIQKFDGDSTKWHPFWDRFSAAVDSNPKLQEAEKLNYLVSLLDGAPLASVEVLPLIGANYINAVNLLKKRYGNKKLLIAQLYRELSDLKAVRSAPSDIREFITQIDRLLGSLEALGQNTTDDNFVTVIMSKLQEDVLFNLEMLKDLNTDWSVTLIRDKLSEYLIRRERSNLLSAHNKPPKNGDTAGSGLLGCGPPSTSKRKPKPKPKPEKPDRAKPTVPCVFCAGENHFSNECTKFPDADSRYEKIKGRCFNCLGDKHMFKNCTRTKPCFYCGKTKSHHSALCRDKFGKPKPSSENGATGADNSHLASEHESGLLASGIDVVLQTASILAGSKDTPRTEYQPVRGFFDIGANRSYCTTARAKQLGLKIMPGPELTVNTFGSTRPKRVPTEVAILRLRNLDGACVEIEVSVIPQITGEMTRYPVDSPRLKKLSASLTLADKLPTVAEVGPIDVLIGNDYYLDFISGEKIEVETGLYLLGSQFGWILSGRVSHRKFDTHEMSLCGFTGGTQDVLSDTLVVPYGDQYLKSGSNTSDFFALETLGITDCPKESSDNIATQDFNDRVCFQNGRYSVGLPWNDRKPELQPDYKLSLGRLTSVSKRLRENSDLLAQYSEIIRFQKEKGIIEQVPPDPQQKLAKHYLPHHAVVKPERETTKVRIVFDGSAKTHKWHPGLNECLHRGPILLEDLAGLILRFRLSPIAILADIEKAFLQIGIRDEDRDFLRFLWLKDPNKSPEPENLLEYRFARVPFGLNCSPSLLAQTVRHHLYENGSKSAKQILGDLYCDNVVTGVETEREASQLYTESKGIFQKASMNLRCWVSNCQPFMDKIPEKDRADPTKAKVLGVTWKPDNDVLQIEGPSKNAGSANSRRGILSCVSSVFDPLGFISPCLVEAKCLLQSLCRQDLTWDEAVPEAIFEKWKKLVPQIEQIPTLSIPRYIPTRGSVSLIAFCDASSSSFATAIYLRSEMNQTVAVNLIMAKSRVNPKKELTIPQLELMGVLIATRGLKFVKRHLRLNIQTTTVFCDSTIALSWLQQDEHQKTFVRNRVSEIRKSEGVQMRHVSTSDNPADIATRGQSPSEITGFWWHGPNWLQNSQAAWPHSDHAAFTLSPLRQSVIPSSGISMVAGTSMKSPFDIDVSSFSSLHKLLRVTAWCLRALDRLNKIQHHEPFLTAAEIAGAKEKWELFVQSESYPTVIAAVKDGKRHSMMQLGVFLDENHLLRCKGRLGKSVLKWSAKYPKLLPKSHPYTRLTMLAVHCRTLHAPVSHTLAQHQLEYWVPRGRSLAQSTVTKCVTCRKSTGKPYQIPLMPELPVSRVNPRPAFTSIGLDYFGPIKVRCCTKTIKSWVCLLTCLCTRAIHLELVLDLTAVEFLMALRRFMSRRGVPRTILSDNAPQFKLVTKLSDAAWSKMVQSQEVCDFSAKNGISWTTIPESAPYMGGVYERLVGVTKTSLRKTVGQALLSVKQFETALCECEALLNTRPLTHVGPSLNNEGVLTPAHFLSLNPSLMVPETDDEKAVFQIEGYTATEMVSAWKKGQKLLSEFWKVWSSEYLNMLRERNSYMHRNKGGTGKIPEEGEVVLIRDHILPRGAWKMARISKVSPSADGEIRSVFLKLPNGREWRRPVSLLVPLEVSGSTSSSRNDDQRLDDPENN